MEQYFEGSFVVIMVELLIIRVDSFDESSTKELTTYITFDFADRHFI